MPTLNEIPKNYSDFIKKIKLDSKSQFPLIDFDDKKFIILNEGEYKLFLEENKKNEINYSIEQKSNYINKNNFQKKSFDLENLINENNQEKKEKIDEEIQKFVNKILELKEKTKIDLEKKKKKFIDDIKKEIYDEKKFNNFIEEENFKKISEHISVIPTPPKITDEYFIQENKKPENCNYCENKVTNIFVKCEKCKFYICQDCYQILSTTFFHQHPLIIERNDKVVKPFDSFNENSPKELTVKSKDAKKIDIKMKNTGTNVWEKGKIVLCGREINKEKYNLDFPETDLKKRTKENETGFFKFEIPWEQCTNTRTEIVLQLKHSEYDVFFGSEVKIIAIK